jgi:hypothetical protein
VAGKDVPAVGQLAIEYRDIKDGFELTALHKWFDAQLPDHGEDAMEGSAHHEGMKMKW